MVVLKIKFLYIQSVVSLKVMGGEGGLHNGKKGTSNADCNNIFAGPFNSKVPMV